MYLCEVSCQRAAWWGGGAPLSDLLLLSRSHALCKAAHWERAGGRRKAGGHPRHPQGSANPWEHGILFCYARLLLLGERSRSLRWQGHAPLGSCWVYFFAERIWMYITEFGLRGLFQDEGFTQTCFLAGVFNGLVYVSLTKIYAGIKGSWVNLPGLFKMHSL